MKYKMKTDLWIRLILWGTILMFIPLFFIVETDEIYILAISTVVMALIILPLFSAYYELSDTELVMHVYGFKKRVKYENIKSIRKCENWLSSSSMSRERIEIVQHHKKKLMGTSYISPQHRDEFFTDFKNKCRNLDYIKEDTNLNAWDE